MFLLLIHTLQILQLYIELPVELDSKINEEFEEFTQINAGVYKIMIY